MKTINKLRAKIKELQTYVEGNTYFNIKIKTSEYPLSISFYEDQIDAFSENTSEISPSLTFVFDDKMRIITAENFKIKEKVFDKLKNLSKEVNRLYLHSFREEIDKVIDPLCTVADGAQWVRYNKPYFDKIMNHREDEV